MFPVSGKARCKRVNIIGEKAAWEDPIGRQRLRPTTLSSMEKSQSPFYIVAWVVIFFWLKQVQLNPALAKGLRR
jgi:hypothetical protein